VLAIVFALPVGAARLFLMLKAPLVIAAALAAVWAAAISRPKLRPALSVAAGFAIGWACALHLVDDVRASHRLKTRKLEETSALARVLTDGTALVGYLGSKDAAVPLLFDRDIVILDARADEARDAAMLVRELRSRDRRVFVLQNGFAGDALARVLAGWTLVPIAQPGVALVELR
jgi:hypothetical protein